MVQERGPLVHKPEITADQFVLSDGGHLHFDFWPAIHAEQRVLIGLHGFNDYGQMWKVPAQQMIETGTSVYGFDLRGFGRNAEPGIFPAPQVLENDLSEVIALVRVKHPNTPIFLIGESMGAAVILSALGQKILPPVEGVILSAPAVRGRVVLPFYQKWALELAPKLFPSYKARGSGFRLIPSDNIPMLRALGQDPHMIRQTRLDAIHGLVRVMDQALAQASQISGQNILMLYGLNDELIPARPTQLLLDEFRQDITLAVYDRGFHMLLRDKIADQVWRDIAFWMEGPNRPLPSKADVDARQMLALQ